MLQFLLDSEFSSVETMAKVTQLTTPAPKKSVADLEETLRTMTSVVKGPVAAAGSAGGHWQRLAGNRFPGHGSTDGRTLGSEGGVAKDEWN